MQSRQRQTTRASLQRSTNQLACYSCRSSTANLHSCILTNRALIRACSSTLFQDYLRLSLPSLLQATTPSQTSVRTLLPISPYYYLLILSLYIFSLVTKKPLTNTRPTDVYLDEARRCLVKFLEKRCDSSIKDDIHKVNLLPYLSPIRFSPLLFSFFV